MKLLEVKFYEQYTQFLNPKNYNWLTFRPLLLELDYDKHGPMVSLDITFLGFGFYISFELEYETPQSKRVKKAIDEVKDDPENLEKWEGFE